MKSVTNPKNQIAMKTNIFLDNNVEIGHIGGIINSDYKGAEFHNFEIFD